MNSIILVGRLSTPITMRQTQNGKAVASFQIAVNRSFDREKADFFTVVVWRDLAENCARYLTKGMRIGVMGRLQSSHYETQNGDKRTAYEVVAETVEFLEPRKAGQSAPLSETEAELGAPLSEDEELPF